MFDASFVRCDRFGHEWLEDRKCCKVRGWCKLQAMTIQTLLTAKSDPLQLAAVRSSYAVTRAVCHGGKDRHSTPTKQEQRCSRMQFICLHGQTSYLHRFWSSCVKLKMEHMVERGRDTVTDLYGLDLIRSSRQQATQVVPWRRWRNAMSLFVAQARQKQKLPRQNTASLAAVFSRHENQDAWLRPACEEREREISDSTASCSEVTGAPSSLSLT